MQAEEEEEEERFFLINPFILIPFSLSLLSLMFLITQEQTSRPSFHDEIKSKPQPFCLSSLPVLSNSGPEGEMMSSGLEMVSRVCRADLHMR